ncbi:DUF397 domain-containing protein [Streptomyces sp. NPDC020996]|uniref:DUF397 domain-containing protein n=1 Tax=Streptomyces sp. NPDC020996 TaxID=3154791 RepID=UPI00340C0CC9
MSSDEWTWFKSSYSSASGDDCVEVAFEAAWFKSSYSSGSGDDCIEVALTPTTVHVRDSKHRRGPRLALSPAAWTAFVANAPSVWPAPDVTERHSS